MTPYFEGSGVTKICPKRCPRNLRSLEGLKKPFFGNLNSKPRGALGPPVAGGPLKSCSPWSLEKGYQYQIFLKKKAKMVSFVKDLLFPSIKTCLICLRDTFCDTFAI